MGKKKRRFPAFVTVIGEGTEIAGEIRFVGGLHLDGRVVGDVIAAAEDGCAVSVSSSGVIEGNLEVPHVLLDGTVVGDVRASQRAELASGARIQGTLYYGLLEMDEGAEVNGKLVPVDGEQQRELPVPVEVASGEESQGGGSPASAGNAAGQERPSNSSTGNT